MQMFKSKNGMNDISRVLYTLLRRIDVKKVMMCLLFKGPTRTKTGLFTLNVSNRKNSHASKKCLISIFFISLKDENFLQDALNFVF